MQKSVWGVTPHLSSPAFCALPVAPLSPSDSHCQETEVEMSLSHRERFWGCPCPAIRGLVYATEELCTERGVSHTLPGSAPALCQPIHTVPGAVGLVISAQRELCCPEGLVRDVQHSNKLLSMHQSSICSLILGAKETVACSCTKILLPLAWLSLRFVTQYS